MARVQEKQLPDGWLFTPPPYGQISISVRVKKTDIKEARSAYVKIRSTLEEWVDAHPSLGGTIAKVEADDDDESNKHAGD